MATKAAKSLFRLRVVNLPWTVGDLQLKQYFSQFGYVANAKVFFDRNTGLSKHTGFIDLADKVTYEKILYKQNHHLEGFDIYARNWAENNNS